MMKNLKITTAALVATMWMFVGCGQPVPDGTTVGKGGSEVDTIDIDESRYENSVRGMNSSADGFQSVYFGFDRYDVTPEMENVIARNARNAFQKRGRIRIEGNCDEFGTDEYNYALGLKRAKAVRDALAAHGVEPARTVLISYGESNPLCTEQSEECYKRNRRVDLRLVR
jgi:peptidoglycan-associated lipoprotein